MPVALWNIRTFLPYLLVQRLIRASFYNVLPACQSLDQWLSYSPSKSPLDSATHNRSAYQLAFDTDEPVFQNVSHRDGGRALQRMSAYTESVTDDALTWYDVFPVEEQAANMTSDQVLWIDVGGNLGHRTREFRAKFPGLPGKLFVQDTLSVVATIPAQPGIESMSHDFFQEQPVKGAKFYYMRHILHDWIDDDCVLILRRLKDAMAVNPVVLIDEIVVPDMHAHHLTSALDLATMSIFESRERTVSEFREIAEKAGLELISAATYKPTMRMSIMALRRAEGSKGEAS